MAGRQYGNISQVGNYAVAKLMEFLFNTTSLTDVGCTARCVKKSALQAMSPFFTVTGSFFGPEMMIISIAQRLSIIQIPVNYRKRVGSSSVTGNKWLAALLGLQMISLILRYRLRRILDRHAFTPKQDG